MECRLDNLNVHYEVRGQGRPVVILHGCTLDHRYEVYDLEPIFERRDGWMRIYPDLPGHGQTPGTDWIANQDKMLDVVLDFIDHVIPRQRFALAGTSAGAYLARGVICRRPESVDGLLMRVPLIVADDAGRSVPPHVTLVEDAGLMSRLDPAEAEGLGSAVVQSQAYLDKMKATILPAVQNADHDFLNKIRQDPRKYAFTFDVDALTEPFAAPTLIVAGRQDSVAGYRDAWTILENYTRATFVVLDRAGHALPVDQPELFCALVNDWLDRVEETAHPPAGS